MICNHEDDVPVKNLPISSREFIMCGIAGVLTFDATPVSEQDIATMNRWLDHRGPDSSGVHVESGLGLGHTRLAVMDPTPAGHQPMSYGDGRFWITYNGEVYNFLEIRETLESLGHRFRGNADTEIVLASFVEWGAECQFRLNGEWAFAIWDRQERCLFLSRDRFGVKPLYYYFDGKRFAFASEMKAFLGLPWLDLEFDPRGMASALANFQAAEGTDITMFENIKRLPSGHHMTVTAGGEPRTERWWRTLDHLVETFPDPRRQAERLRELLFDACTLRMRSDIAMGSAVSGGLDSAAVHAAMAHINNADNARPRQAESWDRAVVCLLPGWDDENVTIAEDVIRDAGTEGIFHTLRPEDALDRLDDLIFHFEQVAPVPVGQWMLYQGLRKNNVLVSMEGHGADESFAGFRDNPKIALLDSVQRMHGFLDAMQRIGVRNDNEKPKGDLFDLLQQLPNEPVELKVGYYPGSELIGPTPHAYDYPIWRQDAADLAELDALTRMLYLQFHCTRTPWILHDFETAAMASGVETRAPFLDWRIICYGFSLPAEAKVRNGLTKFPIRAAMKGYMPESARTRPSKVGFPLPLYAWLKEALRPYILDAAASQSFLESSMWDGRAIRGHIETCYANGSFGHLRLLWTYVQAHQLMQQFRARAASPPGAGKISALG
ncbi:MAG: asparagine synthase (glutamine-hydrolyzing) [Rhodospirillaceae bacterium]|nr:asparagine synthase (glutamine-hydrolyzing) [Rhodospirillaceae bacterium]MBT5780100.1 asparagine synthase (glutamine-hydrolyzing) [Rhodospirillaceae bacterium]MBT7292178.1 asparagine synthase (glutamine-hydrolyzing) [Rhodospirillaceae bacterium]